MAEQWKEVQGKSNYNIQTNFRTKFFNNRDRKNVFKKT